jgi:hypothetical protein
VSTVRGEVRVGMSYETFIKLVRTMLIAIEVDEDWYLQTYSDIADAVRLGTIKSARQHFINDGYFEGRLPFQICVDEPWYVGRYPDVSDGLRKGSVASAQMHFDEDGYREGRLPFGD